MAHGDDATASGRVLLLFETTHAAMEAEEDIISGGFWCDVVPRPAEVADDLCGLAVAVEASDHDGVAELLRNMGIQFESYQGGADDEH